MSSSGNVKVIVRISLLGMMAGSFIDVISIDILGVFLHHHFQNMLSGLNYVLSKSP